MNPVSMLSSGITIAFIITASPAGAALDSAGKDARTHREDAVHTDHHRRRHPHHKAAPDLDMRKDQGKGRTLGFDIDHTTNEYSSIAARGSPQALTIAHTHKYGEPSELA